MLKFACQGQHLKKLVASLGASNIIKAGMSFGFVPLFLSFYEGKKNNLFLYFLITSLLSTQLFFFSFFILTHYGRASR